MSQLTKTIAAWGTTDFETTLLQEIRALDPKVLPLQQAVAHGAYALADKLRVSLISAAQEDSALKVKSGLFYTSVIPGCNCADDPTPDEEYNEYCEILLTIDMDTADTGIELLE